MKGAIFLVNRNGNNNHQEFLKINSKEKPRLTLYNVQEMLQLLHVGEFVAGREGVKDGSLLDAGLSEHDLGGVTRPLVLNLDHTCRETNTHYFSFTVKFLLTKYLI